MTVLVAGGTGLVGGAVVRALAATPAVREIVVTSRSATRLTTLLERLEPARPKVVPLVVSPEDARDPARIRAAIGRVAKTLDGAIASLGAGEPDGRRFADLDRGAYDALVDEMLGAHVAFALATLPLLAADGTYLGIGGGAAYAPMRGGGAMSIAAAAQMMMTRVLCAENERPGVRIRELAIDAAVVPSDSLPRRGAIAARDVGEVVAEVIATGTSSWPMLRVDGPILTMSPAL
jgi:NAD(P)-dependent dehydrogenase (short-subunit alcohol dehydrogenase family)